MRPFFESLFSSLLLTSYSALTLSPQTEKIVKAQDTIAGINDKMNSSDRMIQEIGSFWSSITSRFRSEVPKSEYADRRAEWEDQHTRNMEQVRGSRPSASAWGAPSSKPSAPPVPATASQDQIGRDLDDILLAVRDMKAMAEEMNVSLEEQNRRLDHLNPEIDLTTARIKTARTKVQTLIDKA